MVKNHIPIRVAHIMGKLWAGGVESVVFNYYREIDKTEVQFDFYYDSDSTVVPPEDLISMGARFYQIPPYQSLIQYLLTLKQYFKGNNYKIVHSHINTLSVFPLFVAWLEGIPIRIAHNHSVPGGKEFKRNVLKCLLRKFSKVFATDYFACSEKAGRWLFGNQAYKQGKIVLLSNAIRFDKFQFDAEIKKECEEKYKLKEKFVVGHVGRFTYAKNHDYLLEIFASIKKRKENAILLLVGDVELHNQIVEKIKKLKLEENVILVGKVSNPEKYYSLMNVLLLPSLFEGLPLTVIEAQVSRIPVVVSENIPKEAKISNAFQCMSLKQNADVWAETAIKISGKKVRLMDNKRFFDIQNRAPELLNWYKARIKTVNEQSLKREDKKYAFSFRNNGSL